MQVKTRNVVSVFFLSVIFLWFLTGLVVENVKGNSEGLLAIGYDSRSANMEYKIENSLFIEFNAQITFTNYSEANKEFYIHIQDPSDRDENTNEIQVYELDGKPALFKLGGKQTEIFSITHEDYALKSAGKFENGGGSGTVRKIILEDIQGNKIRLDRESFIGIELGR